VSTLIFINAVKPFYVRTELRYNDFDVREVDPTTLVAA
jgi:hypothetical protein